MPRPKNAMEIFKLLDQSNCRECGEKTCLAFAGAVFRGVRKIGECPKLDAQILQTYAEDGGSPPSVEQNRDDYIEALKGRIRETDLASAAGRTGGSFADGRLTIKILGKDFSIDTRGNISADIHVNPWVVGPFLTYVLFGKGLPPAGRWVSFRDIDGGREQYPLFRKRCEEAMKQVADTYMELFDDMVHLFGGKTVERQFQADISVVLHPFPKVPLMICYGSPEDGVPSTLNVFFDTTANDNIGVGSLFMVGTGLSHMFGKLAQRHGRGK